MRILISTLILSLLFACNSSQNAEPNPGSEDKGYQTFGEEISPDGAIDMTQFVSQLGNKAEMQAKVKGKVDQVCKKKGCWMTLIREDGEAMRVTFKDYGFFVPKDIDGKEVIIEGVARTETTSVADLQHYAEDNGASEEEIAEITEPETEVVFEADGVILL